MAGQRQRQGVGVGVEAVNSSLYEPDIESFVSNCIPGVSFTGGGGTAGDGSDDDDDEVMITQRRTKLIRKRSLPLLSFLSSVHLAGAEMQSRKDKHERRNAIAEEEVK